jgi:MFS family permease
VVRDTLVMMAVVGTLSYEFQVTLPLIAANTFKGNSATYGFLTSSMGIGAVVGGLIAAGRTSRNPRRLVNTVVAFGAVIVLAALAPTRLAEEVVLLFVGAGSVTFISLGNTTLQLEVEPSMRGRVMSLWSVAFLGSTPIGGPLVGFIAGSLGARYGLFTGGVAGLAAGAYGYVMLRRYSRRPGQPVPATADPRGPELEPATEPSPVADEASAQTISATSADSPRSSASPVGRAWLRRGSISAPSAPKATMTAPTDTAGTRPDTKVAPLA